MIQILVVEDDERLNRIVCTYLNDSGFQAKGCLDAKEAYEAMYHQIYDLIISDIMMPGTDGFEFAGTVRKVNQKVPILFMSAKDDLPSKQKGFRLGIDDYMVKPIELDELVLRVRALLRRANIETERKITVGNLVLDADGMSAELLQTDRGTEEERREYARNIEEAAVRLSTLISNILKLNKLENQNIDPDIEDYDLSGQLEMCILQYEDLWDEKELELEVDIEERVDVRADRSLMELVWNNLLSNAVKFTEPGGTVTIRQRTAEGQVEVSVTDTGCGMSQESIRHIFDKFYQGDTSHAREGNGLGLALVKRIIDLMNGEITVVSRPGQGSTFTVRLPAADERE